MSSSRIVGERKDERDGGLSTRDPDPQRRDIIFFSPRVFLDSFPGPCHSKNSFGQVEETWTSSVFHFRSGTPEDIHGTVCSFESAESHVDVRGFLSRKLGGKGDIERTEG